MKLLQCLLLMAIIAFVALTSINCVQNTTTPQPSPSPSPAASATPGPTTPTGDLTTEKLALYKKAIANPYVNKSITDTAWQTAKLVGNQWTVSTSIIPGQATYMRCHEISPGIDRWRTLPAIEIVPGNWSQAGVDVIAFVDGDRIAYIGYVPRPGARADDFTWTSVDRGVDELNHATNALREYRNVTIVDTGYIENMTLSQAQKDQATMLAMTNATVRDYIGNHNSRTSNITVQSYKTGYPDRYILAYPMVTLEVTEGTTQYDIIYVLVDIANNRVVRVEHGLEFKP